MSEGISKAGILHGAKSIKNDPNAKEVCIMEFDNPDSMVYKVPETIRKHIEEIHPKFFGCSDRELIQWAEPNQTEEALRLAFWDEYTVAVDAGRKMKMEMVYGKICSKEYFYKKVITEPVRFAYILRPPIAYTFKMRDLLELGHRRMREILELDLKDARGRPDTRLIAEMVKIVALVENRVRGAVVHKVQLDQKSVNINVEAPKDYFQISDELKNLEREIRSLEHGESEGQEDTVIEGSQVAIASREEAYEGESASSVRDEVLQVAEKVLRVEE